MYWTAVPVSCRPGRGLRITTRGWDGRLFPFSFPALLKSGRFFHLKMRIDYPHEISGGGTPLEIIRRAHFHCFHVTVDVKRPGDHEDRHPWVHLKRRAKTCRPSNAGLPCPTTAISKVSRPKRASASAYLLQTTTSCPMARRIP